jgi:DNA-binding transcriptional LysR family regulator
MTIRHLRIFVAVCETGSVTKAANKLYLAQPSVSLAISELENYYGVKLFDRISRRLHLTDTGSQFLNYAKHIIYLFDELESGMKNWDLMGTLRVGSSITIGNYFLPKYVKEFQKTHPQIKVYVTIDNSQIIEDHVISNKVDFAFTEGIIDNPKLETINFLDDELICICAPSHPLSNQVEVDAETLSRQDLIMRERGSGGRNIFDAALLTFNLKTTPIWESVSTQAIIRAVGQGLGVSILPYLLVKSALEEGIVKQIKIQGLNLHRKLHIIYHKNKYLTPAALDFLALCKL